MAKTILTSGIEDSEPREVPDYGKRNDGTQKGSGYFGELPLKGGGIATEYSIGVNIKGKEVDIPTLVPSLSEKEKKKMLEDIIPNKKKIPDEILKKAVAYAQIRMSQGLSPFKEENE